MTGQRPRILVLDEEVPFPPNTGKRIRSFHLLRRLAGDFEIHLLVHRNGATESALSAMQEAGIETHVAASRVPDKRGLGFLVRLAQNLVSPLPYTVQTHDRRQYRESVRALLRDSEFDLVHCEWTPYAVYRELGDPPWVVSAHNVETEIWQRLAESESRPGARWFLRLQAKRMERFEKQVFGSVGFATAVSDRDAAKLSAWGCPRVQVVANGVDLEENRPMDLDLMESGHVVFVGSMDWQANQDGIRWYLKEVHSLLRAVPGYRLTVVGRNPPPRLCAVVREDDSVAVTGEVSDVRPYLERSCATIVPLRVGGGSRLKILEAFASGRPVVSTTVGAEGIHWQEGCLLLANEPADFAAAIERVTQEPQTRELLARAGRRLVENHYGWDTIAERQADYWKTAIAGGSRQVSAQGRAGSHAPSA